MFSEESIRSLIHVYFKEHRNMEKLLSLFTDDATIVVPGNPTVKGREAIKQFYQPFFSQYPEAKLTETFVIINGEKAVSEYEGILVTPEKREVEVAGVNIFEVEKGKIKQLRLYIDSAQFQK